MLLLLHLDNQSGCILTDCPSSGGELRSPMINLINTLTSKLTYALLTSIKQYVKAVSFTIDMALTKLETVEISNYLVPKF